MYNNVEAPADLEQQAVQVRLRTPTITDRRRQLRIYQTLGSAPWGLISKQEASHIVSPHSISSKEPRRSALPLSFCKVGSRLRGSRLGAYRLPIPSSGIGIG